MKGQLDSLDEPLRSRAASWLKQLDTDAQLAKTLRDGGKLVLGAPYTPARSPGARRATTATIRPAQRCAERSVAHQRLAVARIGAHLGRV